MSTIKITTAADLEANPEFAEIYNDFVKPELRKFRSSDIGFSLKMFFGLDYRSVHVYKVQHDFIVPGDFRHHDTTHASIRKLRAARQGEFVFIRSDDRTNWIQEVQVVKSLDEIDVLDEKRFFNLTERQVHAILKHLQEITIK